MSIMKNKLVIIYKKKFLTILTISVILTIITSFSYLKKSDNFILNFNTSQVNDNEILDIIIHAEPELDDSLLNIYIAHNAQINSYNVGSIFTVDGKYVYTLFKNFFFELVEEKDFLQIKTIKKKKYDNHIIIISKPNMDESNISELMTKIFLETEILMKEMILSQVYLVREEKINNLAIMDDIISPDYNEKFKLIIKRKNKLLKERLTDKKLTDLVKIKNNKLVTITKNEDLIVRPDSNIKFGQILMIFLIYHFMIFFLTIFLKPNDRKKFLKTSR